MPQPDPLASPQLEPPPLSCTLHPAPPRCALCPYPTPCALILRPHYAPLPLRLTAAPSPCAPHPSPAGDCVTVPWALLKLTSLHEAGEAAIAERAQEALVDVWRGEMDQHDEIPIDKACAPLPRAPRPHAA
eukprot:1422769-Prymnesium_polylepis.2